MSLRIQLVLLFTAVLAATLLVASALGLRIGQRSVEDEIRKRTAELASATTLALKHAGTDDDQISEELAAAVRTHRGLLRAEVARQAADKIQFDIAIDGGEVRFLAWVLAKRDLHRPVHGLGHSGAGDVLHLYAAIHVVHGKVSGYLLHPDVS